jgi:hypothetical protein
MMCTGEELIERTLLRGLDVRFVGSDIKFGYINRLVVCVSKEVECEVEQPREVVALLDVLHIVVLDFEGLG